MSYVVRSEGSGLDEAFGRYRLQGLLGAGGMGQVYRAFDTELHREVAIKLLPPQAAADPSFEQRFRREARAAAGLGEPHVIPIFDSGEIDGRLFIAMQLIDGTDIATLLTRHGPMPPDHAVALIEQAAAALDTAHAAGLVHRDIKPANLLVTARNFLYLIDFGIANAPGETKLTNTGAAIGTVAYMAPERFTTGQCDQRADIYALTCVLYECLTGTTPYPAVSVEQQMFAHVNGPPPRPSLIRPGVPAGFDDVIATGMAVDPQQRYPRAGDLANAARTALRAASGPEIARSARRPGSGQLPAAAPTAPAIPQSTAHTPPSAPQRPTRWNFRRRWIVAFTAAAVLIAAAIIGITHQPEAKKKPTAKANPATPIADTIAVGAAPYAVALDPGTHTAYTANFVDGSVSVIDTESRAVTDAIKVGMLPMWVALDPGTHSAYTANSGDSTVSVIDTTTRIATGTINVGKYPVAVAVDPETHTAYTANSGDSTVSVIDTTTRTVTDTINVGTSPKGVAIDATTHTTYTANFGDDSVSVIDPTTRSVNAIKIDGMLSAVAVDPGTHTAYATYDFYSLSGRSGGGALSVIDTATNTVTSTIRVGTRPRSVAVDPETHSAYVTNIDDNTVSVIDTTTNTVTTTIQVGKQPWGIAVDPTTHKVYVTNSGDNTMSVIEPAR